MAVRTKQLWRGTALTAAASTVYTGPSGETTIIKMVTVANTLAIADGYLIYVTSTAAASLVHRGVVAGLSTDEWQPFLVLQPGDTLRMAAVNAAGALGTSGFGAQLEGVAD